MTPLTTLLRSPGVSSIGFNKLDVLGYDVSVWTDSHEAAAKLAGQLPDAVYTVTRDVIDGGAIDYHDWQGTLDNLRVRITYADHVTEGGAR